jgi:hypothetical protein
MLVPAHYISSADMSSSNIRKIIGFLKVVIKENVDREGSVSISRY